MKRILPLILAATFALLLVACGGNSDDTLNAVDKNSSDSYIGIWQSDNMRFTISEGGVGRYEQPNRDVGFFDFTYEISEDLLTIYILGVFRDYVASLN